MLELGSNFGRSISGASVITQQTANLYRLKSVGTKMIAERQRISGQAMSRDGNYFKKFVDIGYDDFRAMAKDPTLSCYEKIGFPDFYRAGYEEAIFADLRKKLPALDERGVSILDIGCGCSDLPRFLMSHAQSHGQRLTLMDSSEMLAQLGPDVPLEVEKIAGRFPDYPEALLHRTANFSVIIVYSVIQYVFAEANLYHFMDKAISLLTPGGRMLVGDIPNISMRKRFFASQAGVQHHRNFTGSNEAPTVVFNQPEPGSIDDAVVLGLAARVRAAGFNAFLLPQGAGLPMANRREDLLIVSP